MKQYPSISGQITDHIIYAFDKLDGCNVRAEWSKKRGFYKFGSKTRLMDETDLFLGRAKQLIIDKYSDDLSKVCKKERQLRAVFFFEFHGPESFAGLYHGKDATVTLIDVAFQDKILLPKDFMKKFGHLEIPGMLYHGKANKDFIDSVKDGSLAGMTFEGVVCKGKYKFSGLPWMFKVKNVAWIQKLKKLHPDQFDELL